MSLLRQITDPPIIGDKNPEEPSIPSPKEFRPRVGSSRHVEDFDRCALAGPVAPETQGCWKGSRRKARPLREPADMTGGLSTGEISHVEIEHGRQKFGFGFHRAGVIGFAGDQAVSSGMLPSQQSL